MRWQPAIRTLPPYHDDPGYIDALKASVEAQLATLDFAPDAILASFHGMPQRTLELGEGVFDVPELRERIATAARGSASCATRTATGSS